MSQHVPASLANHNWDATTDRIGSQFINPWRDPRDYTPGAGFTMKQAVMGNGMVGENSRHMTHPVDRRRHGGGGRGNRRLSASGGYTRS